MTDLTSDLPCPVCRAAAGAPCRGVDRLVLPSVHGERTAGTPLFDELMASGATG